MIEVKAEYVNLPNKKGTDYFIFLDVEVKGHASNTGYTNNTRVCAGISAVTMGIQRLINGYQYRVDAKEGYYHVYTAHRTQLKWHLDVDTVYAINTMVCQLYEIYTNYPKAFKSFELIEKKELQEDYEKRTKPRKEKPYRQQHPMGISPFEQESNSKED